MPLNSSRKAEAALQAFISAMHALDLEYVKLMRVCGVKRIVLHRI